MVFRSPKRQRGAIGLMAALTLGLALLMMLLVVDSGRLYLEQRKLQRIADMAALEAVSAGADCLGPSSSALATARRAATRNGHPSETGRSLLAECGSVTSGANGVRTFAPDASKNEAIRVTVGHDVASSVVTGAWSLLSGTSASTLTHLQAQATAGRSGPALARLNIRSSLAVIDTAKSNQLNALLGALLGTQLQLGVAQWQGLLDANLNLLRFLDALAVQAKISAGDYTELLQQTVKLGDVLAVMAEVAKQDNALVDLSGLLDLSLAAQNAGGIVLGDLLNIQNGTTQAGLDASLQVLQLVQGMIQLANSQHAAEVTLPISVLGLANVSTRVKIIEPPQFSAIGDPALALPNAPQAAGQIYVRTAQTRLLLKIDLGPLLGGLNLGIIQVLPNPSLDVGLEVASASSHVIDYDCSSPASKRLRVDNDAAAVKLMIGTIDSGSFFSSQNPANAAPLVLLRVLGIDIGLGANSPVFAHSETYDFLKPPELDQTPPASRTMNTQDIVASLGKTLAGLELTPRIPLVSLLLDLVTGLIGGLLGSLLDPLLNNLLALLGIDLNQVTVEANLSCHSGRPQLLI